VGGELNLATEMLDVAALSEAAPAIIRVLALGAQSLVEDELGRTERSMELAELAMEVVDTRHLHLLPQASVAFTALGQAQATAGKVNDAMATLEQGLAMRRRYPVGPWGWIHHLMVMSRVAVQAGQVPMAQELLSELTSRMHRYPDGMSVMRARQAAIQAALREQIAAGAREEELTPREREVLVLLQGALTLREIAAALHLSPNTVKTHIQALYRKLGAHSREEAVVVARRDQLI
jgi:LuxR family maltose regulon positive regulatory protein